MAQPTPPPYAAPPPQKYRPRARWFVVGGVLVVLAIGLLVASVFAVLRPLAHEDAAFAADQPQTVQLPAHTDRALFTDADTMACTATDGSGADLAMSHVDGDFSYNQWNAVYRFDTGDGEVTVDCSGSDPGSHVRVGQVPSTGMFVGVLAVGVIGSLLLGLACLVVLIVTTVLFVSRPARPRA